MELAITHPAAIKIDKSSSFSDAFKEVSINF